MYFLRAPGKAPIAELFFRDHGVTAAEGSVEAIIATLEKLNTDEVAARMIHAAVGGISESDITLAEASGARLATTLRANRLFSGHPRDLGLCGSWSPGPVREAINGCDLVLSFGASLSKHTTEANAIFGGAKGAAIGGAAGTGVVLATRGKEVELASGANLSATLEQMTKLQPNFYSIWDFQAHNLSYNISVEFDNYRDRYAWVMKGIEFLRQGIGFNNREPRLLGRMGWFIGQKIGRADEKVQYRRLFKADDDFHQRDRPGRTQPERDNWLVGNGAINTLTGGTGNDYGICEIPFNLTGNID